ncbi:tigger transposable element-derived protein 6 [Plakobranchus ocellatus]|uniref:Tigger transposable element-derived protein 6 n=1 Tax=Plakobranchus ocellatus TaxID=259542 RepID=A0AAV3Y8V8_9GAST|nr:tigger transposable element-derived protein 6 [Plakobranchus ocellatus]
MASLKANPLKRKHPTLTLETKLKLLSEVDNMGKTQTKKEIAEKYGIPVNTLSTILKNREKLEKIASTSSVNLGKKRMRPCKVEDVDEGLLTWFKQARALEAPINGPILMKKTGELGKELGISFVPCSGWLGRFKRRHGIVFKAVSGEAASVDMSTVDTWRGSALQQLLQNYSADDIFYADETGVFYKCLPDKTLDFKGNVCTGGKKAKGRLTVLVAANMSRSEKLPLLIIGKSAKPGCFNNTKKLPVEYAANKKAWMTSDIFISWLQKLDRKFLLQGCSVAMIIDNCPAHPSVDNLKAIKLVFLPPNTTSILQPCDQGIINSFKRNYRKAVVQRYLVHIDSGCPATFNISVLEALYLMKKAWDDISTSAIANCFRHAGFYSQEESSETESKTSQEDRDLVSLFDRLKGVVPVDGTLGAFLYIDEDVPTAEETSIQQIAADLREDKSDSEEDEEETASTTVAEARSVLMTCAAH